jgi:TonB-linked SusC/RagA family outer membrane protein
VYDVNLSIAGGGEKSTVYFSVNYFNQDGTIKGPNFNRISTRLNSEYELGDKLTIGQHFTVGYTKTTGVSGTDITESPPFSAAFEMLPVIPVYDTTKPSGYGIGEKGRAQTWSENPVGVMDMYKRFNDGINFTGDVFLDYNIIVGLNYRFSFGISSSVYRAKQYNEANELRMGGVEWPSGLYQERGEGHGIFIENRLTYSKNFGKHGFSIMATHTEEKNDMAWQATSVEGGYDEEINFWQISGNSGSLSSSGQEFHSAIRSYLGRLTYNYNNKYFLTGIIRRDGSSNFAPENRWGTFPSVSGGWDISRENFFNLEFVNQLKLRAGYGVVGNASVGPYQYTTTIYRTALGTRWNPGVNYNLGPTSQSVIGATRSNNINNRNISWEELAETNIGLDFEAFNRQLYIAGDYFFGEVNNVLSEVPVPGTIGAPERPAPAVNAVSLKRDGWELSVSYRKLSGDFQYSITANLSHSNNEITDLAYGLTDLVAAGGKTTARIGYPAGKFYLLDYQGIYSQADIDALPEDFTIAGETPVVGDAKYRDVNGLDEEGNLTGQPDGKISLDDDRIIMGDPIPALHYGLNFDFYYKIFDLSIFFQGISGRDVYNSYYGLMNSEFTAHHSNYPSYYDPYMNGQGSDPRPIWIDGHGNNLPSARFIENGAYLRLKNVQLGVTIPSAKLDNIRLFLSGQNLLTITKYRGLDPEFEGDIFTPGVDPRGYPVVRSIHFGINFTF